MPEFIHMLYFSIQSWICVWFVSILPENGQSVFIRSHPGLQLGVSIKLLWLGWYKSIHLILFLTSCLSKKLEHLLQKKIIDTLKCCLEQESLDIKSLRIIHNDCNFPLINLILKSSYVLSEFAFGGITQNHITFFFFSTQTL